MKTVSIEDTLLLKNLQGSANLADKSLDKKDKEIVKAAQDFEALLLQQMFSSMWKGTVETSNEESLYRDMLNQAIAEEMSKGRGLGLKEMVIKELKKAK
jgi:Rod binding domain-containing protein